MHSQIITPASFPVAILHLDGDAFFASVEQAMRPELKGRPVVTGRERGIITCANYAAKGLGIRRGLPLAAARSICPDLEVLPDDFETYSLYSRRMFAIMRRFSPLVEEYSIDEGFIDISGMRRVFRTSYQEIARRMQAAIQAELDITVSAGLSLSKSLAKLASGYRKPAGFTAVQGRHIHLFLQRIPLEKVWGFGANTVHLLRKYGLRTAHDFILRSEDWAGRLLGKTGVEIRNELRGQPVHPVAPDPRPGRASISRSRTFGAPCSSRDSVLAELLANLESAFARLRRHRLKARSIAVSLRRRDFDETGLEARLNRATSSAHEALPLVRELGEKLFREGAAYRATTVILGRLLEDRMEQPDLFEDRLRIEKLERVGRTMDEINRRFGDCAVELGSGLFLRHVRNSIRSERLCGQTAPLPGLPPRRRLYLPTLALDFKA